MQTCCTDARMHICIHADYPLCFTTRVFAIGVLLAPLLATGNSHVFILLIYLTFCPRPFKLVAFWSHAIFRGRPLRPKPCFCPLRSSSHEAWYGSIPRWTAAQGQKLEISYTRHLIKTLSHKRERERQSEVSERERERKRERESVGSDTKGKERGRGRGRALYRETERHAFDYQSHFCHLSKGT